MTDREAKPYPVPDNESDRNEAVRSYQIMNSTPDSSFDEINEIAAQICGCPVAYISFIEDDRFWFKSKYGLPDDFEGCPREIAFCSVTVCGFEMVVSNDLRLDNVFKDFHFVVNEPNFRFYCSMPLVTPDGYSIGTICVMDFKPRELTHEQYESMRRLAHQTMAQLRHRLMCETAHTLILFMREFPRLKVHDTNCPNGIAVRRYQGHRTIKTKIWFVYDEVKIFEYVIKPKIIGDDHFKSADCN